MKKGFAQILILGLVAAVFVLGGTYVWKGMQKPPVQPTTSNIASTLPSPSISPSTSQEPTTSLDTATWKEVTFKAVTFKIPKEWWSGKEGTDQGNVYIPINPFSMEGGSWDYGAAFNLVLIKNKTTGDVINDLKNTDSKELRPEYKFKSFTQRTSVIDNKEFVIINYSVLDGFTGKILNHQNAYVQQGSDVYFLNSENIRLSTEDQSTYLNKIISTFKFTN